MKSRSFEKPPTMYRGVPVPDDIQHFWATSGFFWKQGVDAAAGQFDVWVEPGQIWADNDYRTKGRTVRVERLEGDTAVCTLLTPYTVSHRGPDRTARTTPGREVRIKIRRLYPNARGYRLIKEAP